MMSFVRYMFDMIKCNSCGNWISQKEWKLWDGICKSCYDKKMKLTIRATKKDALMYHAIKMACIEAVQSLDSSIPMIVAFDEINYCNESVPSWSWNRPVRQARFHYVPHNPFTYQKKPYNPPKLKFNPKYKPRVSLYRRTNSGSGWW